MMKQPAENTNALPEETRNANERAAPLPRDPDHDEIAEVAKQLWMSRGGHGGSPERDWYEAVEIVRRRRAGTTGVPPGVGNTFPRSESYLAGTGDSRNRPESHWKERTDMDNMSASGSMEHTGSQTGSGIMDQVKSRASDWTHKAEQMMEDQPVSMPRPEHREGRLARTLEQQTARIPSDAWLWAAFGAIGLSLAFELSGREKTANFVGHWAPTFLIIGLYNKMVKLQGSDGL
jgi:hypothetical protein